MSNPSKQKGTAAESAVVRWAREHGYPYADRQPLRGNRDAGDIALCPGVILEVKNHTGMPAAGQPAPAVLANWLDQTDLERANARADIGILVVKRKGTSNPGAWFAHLTLDELAGLTGTRRVWCCGTAPVCMAFGDLVRVLRGAGYGDPEQVPS